MTRQEGAGSCRVLRDSHLHLTPQLQVLDRVVLQVDGYLAYRSHNLFKEDLQHRVGSCESSAHFLGLVEEVFILLLKPLGLSFANCLSALIREYFIVLLKNEIYISFELLIKSFEVV